MKILPHCEGVFMLNTAFYQFMAILIIKNKDGIPTPCFNKKISNYNVILQWMKYSLDYIMEIFKNYYDTM